jgi:hypothetical protein
MDLPLSEGIGFLDKHFVMEDREAVVRFMGEHPDLLSQIADSIPYIEKHFPGAGRSLVLELDDDDDAADGSMVERLYVLIQAPGNVAEAQQRMERLDDEWALDLCENTGELVVVDLDYSGLR